MKIGINLLFLIPDKVGGTETYSRGLVEELKRTDLKNHYVLFCNRENFSIFSNTPNFKVVVLPINATNRLLRLLVEQLVLPVYLLLYRIDIIHSLGYVCPFITPCKSIVTIYDLNWHYHPEDFSFFQRATWRFFVTLSARSSNLIVTTSNSSKDSLISVLNIHPQKIKIVYGGVTPTQQNFKSVSLKRYGIKGNYILTVSAAYPHKNLITLLKAFALISASKSKMKLVIVGLGGRANKEIRNFIKEKKLEGKVLILGWVSREVLDTLYRKMLLFVFPSMYEGFGFPVLEAMIEKKPVISSSAFSLKEVVGSGGVLVEPLQIDEYVKAIIGLTENTKLRKQISERGYKQASKFTWVKTANETRSIYEIV